MRIGKMRERVSLQRETRVDNGQGGYIRNWVAVGQPFYADVDGQSGNEAVTAAVERSVGRWRVNLRDHGATAKDRLIWHDMDDMVLDIVSALPDPKKRGFQILVCESGLVT